MPTTAPTLTTDKSFPHKLYDLLENAERDGYESVVSWLPHGRSFRVNQKEKFVSKVLPRWFRQSKFASFQRQLNLYSFERVAKIGVDCGSYHHPLFLRGMPHLIDSMQRTKIKGTKVRRPQSKGNDPDFYSMPSLDGSASVTSIQPRPSTDNADTSEAMAATANYAFGLGFQYSILQHINLRLQLHISQDRNLPEDRQTSTFLKTTDCQPSRPEPVTSDGSPEEMAAFLRDVGFAEKNEARTG